MSEHDGKSAMAGVLWVFIFATIYSFLRIAELWARSRWVAFGFGLAIALFLIVRYAKRRERGDIILSLVFLASGVSGMVIYVRGMGDSVGGVMTPIVLGWSVRESYLWLHQRQRPINVQEPKLNHE